MFTGIITDIGTVRTAEQRGDLRLTIACRLRPRHRRPRRLDRLLGRVPDRGRQGRRLVRGRCQRRNRLAHRRRTCGPKAPAQPRARAADGRRARRPYRHRPCRRRRRRCVGVCPDGDSTRIGIEAPARRSAPYIAAKGSITLDGVSLTVNEVRDADDGTTHFTVNIIPHTAAAHHARRCRRRAAQLNVEIDVLARYLKRMADARKLSTSVATMLAL